jgi:uncharacterized membrane protein
MGQVWTVLGRTTGAVELDPSALDLHARHAVFALLIAGVFTLMPGRVMHEVVFGN